MTKILSCAAVVGLLVASSSSVFAKGPGGELPPSPRDKNSGQQITTLLPLDLLPDSLELPATHRDDCTTKLEPLPEARAHRFTPPAS